MTLEVEHLTRDGRRLRDILVSNTGNGEREQAGSRTSEPAAGATTEPAGPRILVVEDTPINQLVARGMLAKLGYRVDLASNGREGLAAPAGAMYGAVLMDCHMPELDGFEASRELRRQERARRHTPIIAMTAGGEREKCLAAGMDDYLTKPVRLAELEAALRRWAGPGALDQHEVEDALYAAAEANGLVAEDGPRRCWATIRSGLGAGPQEPINLDTDDRAPRRRRSQ